MTTTTLQTPSLVRAYYVPARIFIKEGYLSMDDRFMVEVNGRLTPLSDVVIDFFSGRFAKDGTPIYQNDIVQCAVPNEFGSVEIFEGVMRFDALTMRFFIQDEGEHDTVDVMQGMDFLKVVGYEETF